MPTLNPAAYLYGETLFWYDCPRVFTLVAGPPHSAGTLLVYQWSESAPSHWAGFVTPDEVQRLKEEKLTLLEVVGRDGYLFSYGPLANGCEIDFSTPGRIPQNHLPDAGAFLYHAP